MKVLTLISKTKLLLVFLLFTGLGCGEESTVENKISLLVYTAQNNTDSLQWQSVSVEITGVGKMPCETYGPGLGISLPEIPYAQEFQVVVEMYGLPECQNLISRGASSLTTLEAADPGQTLFVMVSSAGAFSAPIIANSLVESYPLAARFGSTSTKLPDGRVVIIGGARLKAGVTDSISLGGPLRAWMNKENYEEILDTVEIYDPATGTFEYLGADPISGVVNEASPQTLYYRRAFHAAVYLKSKNQIAVIGGLTQTTVGQPVLDSATIELFDVANKQFVDWQAVGQMGLPRVMPAAVPLDYGNGVEFLLVTGGTNSTDDPSAAQSSYEVIAPTPVEHLKDYKPMIGARFGHKAVQITTSAGVPYIYLIGGEFDSSDGTTTTSDTQSLIDIFDVTQGFMVGPPQGADAPAGLEGSGRVGHTVHFVPGSEQLPASIYVIGGYRDPERTQPIQRIEVLSADTGAARTSEAQNFNLASGRGDHQSTLLPDGRVLVVGGLGLDTAGVDLTLMTSTEIVGPVYPLTGGAPTVQASIVDKANLLNPRFGFNLVSLDNQQVLVTGGLVKVGSTVSMVQFSGVDDVASKPAELYTHNPSDICESQGFCTVVAGTVATETGVDPAAAATGTAFTPEQPAF